MDDPKAFAKEVGPVIRDYLRSALEPLSERIRELETRERNFKYCGTWQGACSYREGNFASFDGSVWHCNRDNTRVKPGTGSDWTLAVKRGRDGKDAA